MPEATATQATKHGSLEDIARLIRRDSLAVTTAAGSGHPTSALSATELMTALLFGGVFRCDPEQPEHPNNDRLIFSKGHATPLYYALWHAAGELEAAQLRGYRQIDSVLEGHPTARFPHVDAATGSLGQGLSIGVGYALNAKFLDRLPYRTFVLLGDSEMAEGSQWEALQIAAHYRLGNLIGILDVNRLGQRGETQLGHDVEAHARRIAAFGWRTAIVHDGHSFPQILEACAQIDEGDDAPLMIIARTIKGRGVSWLEDQDGWHGKALKQEELDKALAEIGEVDEEVRGEIAMPEDLEPERPVTQPVGEFAYELGEKVSTRQASGEALRRIYPQYPDVVVLDGEVDNSTKTDVFRREHPDRFFEMFVAEQNMVGAAIGLARRGRIPFVATFSAFLTRAFDQIRMAPYSDANIKFLGSHSGISIGEDGPSQMGLEDIAMFRTVPGSTVLHPCDAVSTHKLVEVAAAWRGMVYLRTLRQKTPVIYGPGEEFPIGGSKVLRQHEDDIVTLAATGATVHEALAACDELERTHGIHVGVLDLYSIKPMDTAALRAAAKRTKVIVTIEDHRPEGGLGEAVRSELATVSAAVISLAVRGRPRSGPPGDLRDLAGISATAIVDLIKDTILPKLSKRRRKPRQTAMKNNRTSETT